MLLPVAVETIILFHLRVEREKSNIKVRSRFEFQVGNSNYCTTLTIDQKWILIIFISLNKMDKGADKTLGTILDNRVLQKLKSSMITVVLLNHYYYTKK
jgi:hypothetical protein